VTCREPQVRSVLARRVGTLAIAALMRVDDISS
jgi:hypothetical protein